MARPNSRLRYVLLQAYKILEAEVREKDKLKEFLSVLRKPTGPCPEHFLDHMLRGAKGAKHFPDVDLDDPRQLADIFHSFFRRFLDNIPPIEKGRSWHYLGKFSKGPMKGKVFSFRTDKGKGVLINGFELVDKDHWAYTHLDVDINNLKRYCHRASDALLPGRIGGGFGAGLGGYCAEQLYHRICADFDHQISQIEAVSMQIGRAASIPVGITVGGNVATYFAGLQSVSMLGPVKFQMCALLAGSGAGFLVGAAITGGSAVVGLTVDTMWRETAECLKLAQAAKERCVQLQGHVQTIQQDMTLRLNAIASDIDSVERMVCNAQQTLKAGMKSEEEILQWIGVGQAGKLVLQHILLAIEKLEEDIYKHLQCLRDEHAKTEQDLRAAVRRQENDDNPPTLVAFLWSAPLCLFGPVGMCATALFTGLSAARKYSLQNAIDYHVRTCALLQEAMKQLKSATGTCAKNRRTCCDLIEKIEYALDRWYARLHRVTGARLNDTRFWLYLISVFVLACAFSHSWLSSCLWSLLLWWPSFSVHVQWHPAACWRFVLVFLLRYIPFVCVDKFSDHPIVSWLASLFATLFAIYFLWPCIPVPMTCCKWWKYPRAPMRRQVCLVVAGLLAGLLSLVRSENQQPMIHPLLAFSVPLFSLWPYCSLHMWLNWESLWHLFSHLLVGLILCWILPKSFVDVWLCFVCTSAFAPRRQDAKFEESWFVRNIIPAY